MAANDFANKLDIRAGPHICGKTVTFDDAEYGIRFLVGRGLR